MLVPLTICGYEFPWIGFSKSHSKKQTIPNLPFTQEESTGKKLDPLRITPLDLGDLASQCEEDLNQKWDHHLSQVMDALMQEQGSPLEEIQRQNLQQIFEKLTFKNIQIFFDYLVKKSAKGDTYTPAETALEAMPLKIMLDMLKEKYPETFLGLENWIETVVGCLPEELPPTASREERLEASRSSNVITRFFPNLAHIFLRAFDLFDTARPPETLYEYGVLVTLYFHFFQMPYVLFQGLSQVIQNPLNVLAVATCIIGMAVGILYLQLRWQKCPDDVSYCVNLTREFKNGKLDPVLCRETEYAEGLGCIGNGKHHTRVNFVLIGEPGTGKTEWINGLPALLPDKKIFALQNGKLFGISSCVISAAEKMANAFWEVRFYENEIVFVCDELGDAFDSRPADLEAFLKPVLGNKSIQFIAVMTNEQWEALKKRDKGFEERFKPIFLKPTQNGQTERILADRVRRCAKDIHVTHEALLKVIEETNKLVGHSQPRKAIGVLNEMINKVHQFNPDNYSTPELREAQDALSNLRLRSELSDSPLRDPFSERCIEYLAKVEKAKQTVTDLEKLVIKQKKLVTKITKFLRHDKYYQEMMNAAARRLTSSQSMDEKEKEQWQKRFVFSNFFALQKLKVSIDKLLNKLNADIYVCMNSSTVDAVMHTPDKDAQTETKQDIGKI